MQSFDGQDHTLTGHPFGSNLLRASEYSSDHEIPRRKRTANRCVWRKGRRWNWSDV